MTTEQLRQNFNRMIEGAKAVHDRDAIDRLELCREYFANPTFKRALQDALWDGRNA